MAGEGSGCKRKGRGGEGMYEKGKGRGRDVKEKELPFNYCLFNVF